MITVLSISVKSQSASLHKIANSQATSKMNISTKVKRMDEIEPIQTTQISRTLIKPLPDWSILLGAITKIISAAQKLRRMLKLKPRAPADEDRLFFRQIFAIRSYEIGADWMASIETFMNYLQETAFNHTRSTWLPSDGFGSTPEMRKRDLVWVVTRMQILVDSYPYWEDVVKVDTWLVGAYGKNALRRDWLIRDCSTGQTLTRGTSVWVMMNKRTRKLSKIPKEVREEIEPYFLKHTAILDVENTKLPKVDDSTADHIQTGLSPHWSDLDVNQHVNNVKYVGWILKSTPILIFENYELASITLEYRRECGKGSMLQSVTAISNEEIIGASQISQVKCQHLLRLEGGEEIMRASTEWRPKSPNGLKNMGPNSVGTD